MASDVGSARKRIFQQVALSHDEVYAIISCALCRRRFDDDERTPRVLHCGHHFCTSCLGALVQQQSAREWSIACPLDGEQTPLMKNDAATIGTCFAVVAEIARLAATGALPFRVHVKNLAGDTWPLVVAADDTLDDLKRRIHEERAECAVHRQRLMIQREDNELVAIENDDSATLRTLDIGDEGVVTVVMRDGFGGVAYVRSIVCTHLADIMCTTLDGDVLFVELADDNGQESYHVRTVRPSESAIVKRIPLPIISNARPGGVAGMCVSHDGALLFATNNDDDRVLVVRIEDGALERILGSCGQGAGFSARRVCLSRDGEHLFIVDSRNHRVRVVRVSDGAHVRTIGSSGDLSDRIHGLCVSPDGARMFVADRANHRVVAFRAADGTHDFSIGAALGDGSTGTAGTPRSGNGDDEFMQPSDVCVSPCGQWLFVADCGNARVQVRRASDGAHEYTIESPSSLRRNEDKMNRPFCVRVSSDGNTLFVLDVFNDQTFVFAIAR